MCNVGDDSQQSTKPMVVEEAAKHLTGVAVAYADGDADPRNYRVSFDKITQRLGFRPDHTVQNYLGALVAAVQAGVFPDVRGNTRYGNHEVRHLD